MKTLTQYLLFVAALGICLLIVLRPSAIPEFLVTLLFVTPAYVLFERGRVGVFLFIFFVFFFQINRVVSCLPQKLVGV